jgi:hypothetical protein
VTLIYSASDTSEVIHPLEDMASTDWNTYLSNTETANCPITSCTLFEAGCSTPLTSPISMGALPFDVTALKNDPVGYTQDMCIECTNGAQTVQIDNWSLE